MAAIKSSLLYVGTFVLGMIIATSIFVASGIDFPMGSVGVGVLFAYMRYRNIHAKKASDTAPVAPQFPAWARVGLAAIAVYIFAYFALSPMIKDDASRFLRYNIASHYSVSEIMIPWTILLSDRSELIALITDTRSDKMSSITLQTAGHCILGGCVIGARNIYLLPYQ